MIEVASIATVVVLTYLVLQVLGPRPEKILLSAAERTHYTKNIIGRFGTFVYIANVVGAITSLATVYVFFIGSSQLFGAFIYVCIISMFAAGPITSKLTDVLLTKDAFRTRLAIDTPTAAAITSLFWSSENRGVARLIQILTQISLLAILWLEFATLTKLSIGLFGLQSSGSQALAMFVAVFFMSDFIMRNGLRGFLFADLLEFPLILIGIAGLLIGTALLVHSNSPALHLGLLVAAPKLPLWWCLIFVAATLFLNSFLILTSESHWLRVWTMREQVQNKTSQSTSTAAVMWLVLVAIGLYVPIVAAGMGVDAVVEVVRKLGNLSVFFSIAFWIAAIAAMFSATDSQIYSLLVVSAFDPKTGNINETPKFVAFPLLSSASVALAFSALYLIVEVSKYPFEPLVFFVFPIFLCAVPSFVQMICEDRVSSGPVIISMLLYFMCGAGMIILPNYNFPLSLAAPLMPAVVSAFIFIRSEFQKNNKGDA
jgi:hypothetical protein